VSERVGNPAIRARLVQKAYYWAARHRAPDRWKWTIDIVGRLERAMPNASWEKLDGVAHGAFERPDVLYRMTD